MAATSVLLLAAALATAGSPDAKVYAACRAMVQGAHHGRCTWRSGSLSAGNGQYSTRIAFRHGRPGGIAIVQPGEGGEEFIPAHSRAIPLHIADLSAIDGDYLVCGLPRVIDPYDLGSKLDVACLAGARRLRAGSSAWTLDDAPPTRRKRRRR